MTVTPFPMSEELALSIIREAAADSGRYTIPSPPDGGPWFEVVNRRQVELCLREGGLAATPRIDERGSVVVNLERFSAGVQVRLTVVLWKKDVASDWSVAVTHVERRP